MSSSLCPELQAFLAEVDAAVEIDCTTARCHRVKDLLEELFHSGRDLIPAEYLRPCETSYARHLLHRDPAGRYSIVMMVWNVGQGTYLHDHAGEWCVECVYRGQIRVQSYDLKSESEEGTFQFEKAKEVLAGIGNAGALIPPFDYHTISNALPDTASITMHIYGHELTWCHIFEPVEGGFKRVRRELGYTA